MQEEFRRLTLNRLDTIDRNLVDFLKERKGLSLFTFNCQSLRAHSVDLTDIVIQNSNVIILSETWLHNNENVDIDNFNCVVKFKRPNHRAGGVGIFHNSNDSINIATPSIDFTVAESDNYGSMVSNVGDLCVAECAMGNGTKIVIVAIYISPNKAIPETIEFLHRTLLQYTRQGAEILRKNYHELPMILSGDFNVNFAAENLVELLAFLQEKFQLTGTTIDAIFSRYLENVECINFVSYFSYYKPIVTRIPLEIEELE